MKKIHPAVSAWIVRWFLNNSTVDEETILHNLSANYLQNGWIDSLKLIGLIADIEEHFSIQFAHDEFQDRAFSTVQGLMETVSLKSSYD